MVSRMKNPFCIFLACVTVLPLFLMPTSTEVASAAANDVIVNVSAEKQVIRGFGGMNHSVWIGDLSPAQRETAFGNGENQLGFSVLRIPIDENKNNWQKEVETAKKAIEHGAIVFASPWNPPSEMVETFNLGTSTGSGTTYEAETGTTLHGFTVEKTYSGYSGAGYVDAQASSEASVQWGNIAIGSTGTKNVSIRYSLQTGTSYLDVYVNGTKTLSQVAVAATGSWSTWDELSVQVPMQNGISTLKLVTTGADGANIDNITVSPYVAGTTGKRLKHDMYQQYAQHLNDFDSYMKQNGVELYAISVQNEPDYAYDWTWWSPEEMLRFMKENAGSINNRVIAPESFSYVKQMSDPILNDPAALTNMDILGTHTYGTKYSDFPYPLFEQKGAGKELWMTEVYYPNSETNSADRWPEALGVAEHMYNAMVEGNFQAYVWWYIRRLYGPMKEDGTISKRGYSMAHYSKFIRPGYVRVEATKNPNPQVYTSAYKGDNKVVIVAINKGTSAVSENFVLQNGSATQVSSWVTDGSRNLAASTPSRMSNNSFTAELPAQSVTTFVAERVGSNAPAASLSADNSVKPGSSFTVGVSLEDLTQSVYAEDLTLAYDTNVFDYVSSAGANNNIQIVTEDKATAGKVRLIAASIGGVSGTSTPVLNLTFKVKAGVQNTTGNVAATQAKLGVAPEGTVIQAELGSKSIAVGKTEVVVDKTALTTAITSAQGLYDAAVVGTLPGQYPQAVKDALGVAINAAKAVKDSSGATQSQVDNAITALGSAVDTFKAAVIKEVSADLNKDGIVDVGDLALVAYYYGKNSASADWAAAKTADMNSDNRIDITDLAYVASKILP